MVSIKSLLEQQIAINKKLASDALKKQRNAIINAANKLEPIKEKKEGLTEGSIPWLKNALDFAKVSYKQKDGKATLQKLLDEVNS